MFDDPLSEDLRIQTNLPITYVVAVLDDPVIDSQAFLEIGCESTADPGGNTSRTQSRTASTLRRSEWPRIERTQPVNQIRSRSDLIFHQTLLGNSHAARSLSRMTDAWRGAQMVTGSGSSPSSNLASTVSRLVRRPGR